MIAREVTTRPAVGDEGRRRRARGALSLVVLLAGLFYVAIVGATVSRYGGNLSSLIGAPDNVIARYPGQPGHHVVIFHHAGYDGAAYYYIAGNPFMRWPALRDALRYQRIGYPLLVWACSLGRRDWQPVTMVGVNVAAVLAIALLAGLILRLYARVEDSDVWWALLCAVNPGLIIGTLLDLAEPLALALSLAGLLLYLRRRIVAAALLFAAALLTREVAILFLLPVLVAELWARRSRPVVVLALSIAPFLAWQVVVRQALGDSLTTTAEHNFEWPPLRGMVRVLTALPRAAPGQRLNMVGVVAAIVLVVAATSVAATLARRHYDVVIGALLVHGLAALCAGWVIWQGYRSAPRVFSGLYPLIVFAYVRQRGAGLALLVGGVMLLTMFTALQFVIFSPTYPYYVTP